ncbi:MAG: DUF262 domain-containing protein [Selenomonadaceae bacterium]|nr:DUF262 domain-containing protein [Selenomonadaceae bacterium]
MKIELKLIPIREVVKNFDDDPVHGCTAYGGRLNIRPEYQREFVYSGKQRDAVIDSVRKNFPLNVMYWVRNGDGNFEMLDGQQRTISICRYVKNFYPIDHVSFDSLSEIEREQILNYELMIYLCDGTDKEKLDWFKIINIAGEKLTTQEARNAIYSCAWLTDAKKFFSRNGCPAQVQYGKYLSGKAIRQEILETALEWIADRDDLTAVDDYMDAQKVNRTPNATELWNYFESVFAWVEKIFPTYRGKLMKGLKWGIFFNKFSAKDFDAAELEQKISRLLKDKEVTNKRGIYEYLLTGDEIHLSLRQFDDDIKQEVYERQSGICAKCKKHCELEDMEADHIDPWSKGGKTTIDNCQLLCKNCNRRKSDK